jgi:ABC-type branched-subunit amino acid transport system ATPase component
MSWTVVMMIHGTNHWLGWAPMKPLGLRISSLRSIVRVTIVLIEHNLNEAKRVCQRFVVLHNGRLIADGAVSDVLKEPNVVAAYIGTGLAHA